MNLLASLDLVSVAALFSHFWVRSGALAWESHGVWNRLDDPKEDSDAAGGLLWTASVLPMWQVRHILSV